VYHTFEGVWLLRCVEKIATEKEFPVSFEGNNFSQSLIPPSNKKIRTMLIENINNVKPLPGSTGNIS